MMAVLSSGERHYLLKGHFDTLPVIQSRVVRIYISSGLYGNITAPRLCIEPRSSDRAAVIRWPLLRSGAGRLPTAIDGTDRRTDGH